MNTAQVKAHPRLTADAVSIALSGRTIVRGVSFALEPGRLTGLIGPNGSGKTTLLRAAAGLLPVEAGAIMLGERPVLDVPARARARTIAYLPQGHEIHWPLSVERIVALGRLPHLSPFERAGDEAAAALARALEAADVAHLQERRASDLSGGERARVLLARALAVEAPILLADEPVAALDPHHQLRVMQLLRARAEAGGAVLVVLHDLTLASRFCDSVLVLNEGRLAADGPPDRVLTSDLLRRVYRVEALSGHHGDQPFVVPWRLV